MSAPTTSDEFLELMRKSGVMDDKRLDAYLQRLAPRASLAEDVDGTAGRLVRDGMLTQFQADQLLLGRWRRFAIGKYKVLEPLGSGGMGRVFLCEHKYMRRRVAVKVLPAAMAADPSALERFYREARAVAALDHPNIVRAYDIDEDNGLHFLVMEHIDGASLHDIVTKHGPMDVFRAIHYVRQAALGLQHAHETAALVHRDIKPGNILVDRQGVVKILDLGLVRFFDDDEVAIGQDSRDGVLGTADYLAPEQARDSQRVDIRADIYSLGATFYFCVTGVPPFPEGTVAQKLRWHQSRTPKPVRELRPELLQAAAMVLEKMMAKDIDQRYQLPSDVVAALAPWAGEPTAPQPQKERLKVGAGQSRSNGSIGGSMRPAESVKLPAFLQKSSGCLAAERTARPGSEKEDSGIRWESSAPETEEARARADTLPQAEPQSKRSPKPSRWALFTQAARRWLLP